MGRALSRWWVARGRYFADVRKLATKIHRTLADPRRLLNRLNPAWRSAEGLRKWNADGTMRVYSDYEDYVSHQRSKLSQLDLAEYDESFRNVLKDRLSELEVDLAGASVLCLAARIGTEVKAFHDLGSFAVGVDLEPGSDNGFVLPGDFHKLQFPDDSADVVYTNSLDHALDLARVAAEVERVLADGGHAIIEVTKGTDESGSIGFGRWEARSWRQSTEVLNVFVQVGLTLCGQSSFTEPWPGVLFLLRKDAPQN